MRAFNGFRCFLSRIKFLPDLLIVGAGELLVRT